MLDNEPTDATTTDEVSDDVPAPSEAPAKRTRKAATKKTAAKKTAVKKTGEKKTGEKKPAAKKTGESKPAAKRAPKAAAAPTAEPELPLADSAAEEQPAAEQPAEQAPARKQRRKKPAAPVFQAPDATATEDAATEETAVEDAAAEETAEVLPDAAIEEDAAEAAPTADSDVTDSDSDAEADTDSDSQSGNRRRRRRRGGRRRRKGGGEAEDGAETGDGSGDTDTTAAAESSEEDAGAVTSKRRRRRRRAGDADAGDNGDDGSTVTRVRKARSPEDEITAVSGSTRLEAKKQRRREGREAGRRRAPIVSEAEFLARRESVDRSMVVRQREDLTQIAVLEDGVLVEHYVARESQTSLIGNVYLGRVQNVLPSMEAAFVDIGKGRNAVLYAGEVNWSALGHVEGQPRKIESVLSSGQSVLVQVTKDPIGNKGARLTSQVSLAGRFLVYVPDGTTSGISRKLPDTERARLKAQLKEIVPPSAGVIVRTAAEGATEDQLTRDVERLRARWDDIESKLKGGAPTLLYGEPDLTLKVVRDLFTEDFRELVVDGEAAWETVHGYVAHVAPDLEDRLSRHETGEDGKDVFAAKRIDEQIAKGLDRKVWLPSGGSLIFDRTEAMTVVDVNTGKFTGSGGNLEETVTKNNLEAAEELVRQLRLRDLGGIVVVDFIDMVLESNRDLVLRRLVECLGRDRTRHQVAEVTSLGLVQLTRKRIGTGLLEAFSESCDHCSGRGLTLHDMPVEPTSGGGGGEGRRGRRRGGKARSGDGNGNGNGNGKQGGDEARPTPSPSPSYVAAVAKPENADRPPLDEEPAAPEVAEPVTAEPVTAEPVTAEPVTAEPEAVEPEAPEPEPPTAEPEAPAGPPRVTRSTRRRSAVRPAGSPEGATAAVVVAEPEPASATVVSEAPPPAVVTTTRSRRTRRADRTTDSEAAPGEA